MTALVRGSDSESLPKHTIFCVQHHAVAPDSQVTTASRAGIRIVHLLDGRHEPFFWQPTTLTDNLINVRN
jgi:hypothetical protein